MSAPHIRPARSTDAGAVGGILSGFIDETPWMPRLHSRAQDIAFAGTMIARGWVDVAEDAGGGIQGFSACEGGDLNALYVAEPARRSGIGSALLARLQQSRERLSLWTFQANAGAQAFYLGHGFSEIGRSDGAGNDEGLPDIRFVWKKEPR